MSRTFPKLVSAELVRARRKFPRPHNSRHEALGVLLEEFEEFKAEVMRQDPKPEDMLAELVQMAAMCQRSAEDILPPGTVWRGPKLDNPPLLDRCLPCYTPHCDYVMPPQGCKRVSTVAQCEDCINTCAVQGCENRRPEK